MNIKKMYIAVMHGTLVHWHDQRESRRRIEVGHPIKMGQTGYIIQMRDE